MDTAKDKDLLEQINQKLDTPPSSSRGGKPTKSAEQKKTELDKKKQDRAERYANDVEFAVTTWLNGVAKETNKAEERLAEVADFTDADTKQLYTNKFTKVLETLSGLEGMLKDKTKIDQHRNQQEAGAKMIERLQSDVKAFDRLKSVYLPQSDTPLAPMPGKKRKKAAETLDAEKP